MKYFSMFTGVGGFDLALNNLGHECVGYSEIDKYAIQTYQKNFGKSVINYGDATKINERKLPDCDIICGGFPCQSFSIAGKRRGFSDTRGTMFFEIARILKAKRPSIVFLENVKGLLNHDDGNTFTVILESLDELGYEVQWMVFNSKFFGVPQNRERVFIIASTRGSSRPKILPLKKSSEKTHEQREFQEQVASTLTTAEMKVGRGMNMIQLNGIQRSQGQRIYSTNGISQTLSSQGGGLGAKTGLYAVLTPDRFEKRQNGRRFKNNEEAMFTLGVQDRHGVMIQSHSPRSGNPEKGGTGPLLSSEHSFTLDSTPHNVIEGTQIRRLTPVECERLQGFPDDWTGGVSDTQRYKQMGNAVTVNVIEAIIKQMTQGGTQNENYNTD